MSSGEVDASARLGNGRGRTSQRSPAMKIAFGGDDGSRGREPARLRYRPEAIRSAIGRHTVAVLRINKSGGIHRQFRRACRHPNRPKLCWVVDTG